MKANDLQWSEPKRFDLEKSMAAVRSLPVEYWEKLEQDIMAILQHDRRRICVCRGQGSGR